MLKLPARNPSTAAILAVLLPLAGMNLVLMPMWLLSGAVFPIYDKIMGGSGIRSVKIARAVLDYFLLGKLPAGMGAAAEDDYAGREGND